MSNRNNHQNKQAARERLRAERERQAKKDRVRRQLFVGGAVVAVLAIAGGIGYAVTNMNSDNANQKWRAAAEKKTFTKPANATGPQGTTVVIGDKKAKNTLHVYEDMRCPVCAQFEQYTGPTVLKDIKDGTYKAQFTMGTFLDDNKQMPGAGSKNALSALGAALNVSPQAFLDYKEALYAPKNHPEETKDSFADNQKLIDIAQQVKELKGNTAFEKAVKNGTYDRWALAMSKTFNDTKDVTGTPSFKLNGKKLEVGGNPPMTPDQFTPLVKQGLKK
ncbi:DsbA family protein [Streptomyces samsunensis]|uniref:DsbA family protein n=3 Tax=Streptomyces TaxID=1883 RepID=A0ABX6W529_STRMQ|nr:MULTISPECIES: thioredoxin domain-containing protein [Streptomyces]AQA11343.1 disulfide bond formation protein DsbA [Streptomyces autolyticus]MCC4322250.1 DsbA family protein [Streptomyces malaysiensis]MCD9594617.1 DsbA family protein [Streptomyces sp. 8ZJF_21]MCM3807829.1 DsbA family protein [Streptomyces sp. DR7-3]MCQ6252855.1 DsbA family protein [Streptomyces malaysiensis]